MLAHSIIPSTVKQKLTISLCNIASERKSWWAEFFFFLSFTLRRIFLLRCLRLCALRHAKQVTWQQWVSLCVCVRYFHVLLLRFFSASQNFQPTASALCTVARLGPSFCQSVTSRASSGWSKARCFIQPEDGTIKISILSLFSLRVDHLLLALQWFGREYRLSGHQMAPTHTPYTLTLTPRRN